MLLALEGRTRSIYHTRYIQHSLNHNNGILYQRVKPTYLPSNSKRHHHDPLKHNRPPQSSLSPVYYRAKWSSFIDHMIAAPFGPSGFILPLPAPVDPNHTHQQVISTCSMGRYPGAVAPADLRLRYTDLLPSQISSLYESIVLSSVLENSTIS